MKVVDVAVCDSSPTKRGRIEAYVFLRRHMYRQIAELVAGCARDRQ